MTIYMKKLASILLMLTCLLGLTACSDEKKEMRYDDAVIRSQSQLIYSVTPVFCSEEQFAAFDQYTDDQYDAFSTGIYETTGIRVDGEVFVAGIRSWDNAQEEIGQVVESNKTDEEKLADIVIEAKEDELFVSIPIDGSIHDATMEIIYDDNFHVTNITTNIIYSFGELMEKAGVNTMIGMGTVFIILILISLIISCFGIIPKIQASLAGKKTAKDAAEDSVDHAIAGIIEREEVSDDCELIAVIAAAIAASEGAASTDGFVVRSIRKIR